MKVYAVEYCVPYEGCTTLDIYATKEAAETAKTLAMIKYDLCGPHAYDSIEVEEYTVKERP